MAIQTGISIAAIAIAVIAIGISAAMVSSIGQDMTELKSSIEKLSQTETRGVIEQQGGDRAIGGNTEESSTPGGKEVNFSPSFEMGGPSVNENLDQVENLRDKIRELQYKLRILDNTVSGVQLKEDVLPMGVDVPAGESVEREIRCWNPTSVFASFNHERIDGVEVVVEDVVDMTRDTSQADAFLRDYCSIATFTNNNSDDVTVGYFIFCTKLEVPIYEAQSRGAMDQQAFAPPKFGESVTGTAGYVRTYVGVDSSYSQFYAPEFAKRVQGMDEVIDIVLIAELEVPLTNQDKQSFYKIQKMIQAGTMTPKLFESIKSIIKDISTENNLSYDCQDLSGNLAEFNSDTLEGTSDCPEGQRKCSMVPFQGECCDVGSCIRGTCTA